MSVQRKRKYDSDFKRNAVLLSEEPSRSVSEVAGKLGVNKDLIYRWRRQMREKGELAFPGHGKMALTADQKKIRELEKKLKDVEMEREILKKPWPSSAGHRNEIQVHREQPLVISGEEDVPGV